MSITGAGDLLPPHMATDSLITRMFRSVHEDLRRNCSMSITGIPYTVCRERVSTTSYGAKRSRNDDVTYTSSVFSWWAWQQNLGLKPHIRRTNSILTKPKLSSLTSPSFL